MANPPHRKEMMAALVAMQHDALDAEVVSLYSDKTGIDAVNYWPYSQESFPYIVNRILGWSTDPRFSEDIRVRNYTVSIEMVYAHFQEGYLGEKQEEMYDLLPILEDYLEAHPWMTTQIDPTPDQTPKWVFSELTVLNSSNGMTVGVNSPVGALQVMEQMVLEIPVISGRFGTT